MFDKFGMVMVVVSDMERSVAFYRDVLGLTPRIVSPYWSDFEVGGVTLGLHPESPGLAVNPQGGVQFGFYTNDIDATLGELELRGAPLISRQDQEFGVEAKIADPDGYVVQICQMKH